MMVIRSVVKLDGLRDVDASRKNRRGGALRWWRSKCKCRYSGCQCRCSGSRCKLEAYLYVNVGADEVKWCKLWGGNYCR